MLLRVSDPTAGIDFLFYISTLLTFINDRILLLRHTNMSNDVLNKTSGNDFLQTIAEVTSGLMGRDLLLETAKQITTHLGMKNCFIAECANEDKTRLRTVVF